MKNNKATIIRTIALLMSVLCTLMLFVSCEIGNSEKESGKYGKAKVEIKDFYINSTWSGNEIIVTYSFTNNSNSNQTFDDCFDDAIYQNGVALDYTYEFENYWNDVKPGATVDVQASYKLSNTTDDIEIEISVDGENKIIISKTYSLTDSE